MSGVELPNRGFFDDYNRASVLRGARSLGKAAYTVVVTPKHSETINVSMKALRLAEPLPVQPKIPDVKATVANDVLPRADKSKIRPVNMGKLLYLGGALIQFSDHVPDIQTRIRTPYSHLDSLYQAVTERAADSGPLTFPDQLSISLEQNEGDLQNALWQLFLASRFYARRRDLEAVEGAPTLTDDERLASMMAWQHSLAACVPYTEDGYQDAAGDTYYCWTHALAKTAFEALPARPNKFTNSASKIFENGTEIMQGVVNRLYPEGGGATARNHGLAAAYGNAIGEVCVSALAIERPSLQ